MNDVFGYPHSVIVTTMKPAEDSAGVREPVPDKTVTVPCKVVPASAAEITARGLTDLGGAARTIMKVTSDSWPGGIYSEIEWNGRRFNQEGESAPHTAGFFSNRVVTFMVAQSAEFK
ncbi:MAG TPA: hypothetical protein VF885_26660 [Arthrobacter sp.]